MESCAQKLASCADFVPIFYVDVDEKKAHSIEAVEAVNGCLQLDNAPAHGDHAEAKAKATVLIDATQMVNENPTLVPDQPKKLKASISGEENINPNETTEDSGLIEKYVKAGIDDKKSQIISMNSSQETKEHVETIDQAQNGFVDEHTKKDPVKSCAYMTALVSGLGNQRDDAEEEVSNERVESAETLYLTSKEEPKNQQAHENRKSSTTVQHGNRELVLYSKSQNQNLEVKIGDCEDVRFAIIEGQRFHMMQDIQFMRLAYYGGTSIGDQSEFYLYNLPMVSLLHTIPRLPDVIMHAPVSESANVLCNTREYGYCILKGADTTSLGGYQSFEHELATGIALSHKNLLTTYGPILSEDGMYFAGMLNEYMPIGSLKSLIVTTGSQLALSAKRSILQQVATGLEYMHRNDLVHNNLQPENILLKLSSGVALVKISNFSKTRGLINGMNVSDSAICRNKFYSDPALDWNPDGAVYSRSSDVYSMGMVMLQTMAGEIRMPDEVQYDKCLKEAFINPFTIFQPDVIADNWWKLITSCLSLEANDRPTMHEVLETIREFEYQDI